MKYVVSDMRSSWPQLLISFDGVQFFFNGHLSGLLGRIFDSERTIWGEQREKSIATTLEKNSVYSYPVLQGYNDENTASCWQVVHISGCGLETGALCFNVQALNRRTQQSSTSVWNY